MHTTNNILGTLQDSFVLKQDLFWRGFKIAVTDCCPSKQDLRNIWEKLKNIKKITLCECKKGIKMKKLINLRLIIKTGGNDEIL